MDTIAISQMMMSPNGNILCITGPLCREFTGDRWIPRTVQLVKGEIGAKVNFPHKGQWRGSLMSSLICALNKWLSKQWWGWWFETPSCSLWRHCNVVRIPIKLYSYKMVICTNHSMILKNTITNWLFNSSWPSNAIWHCRFWLTLVLTMAWLAAWRHQATAWTNAELLLVGLWNSPKSNSTENTLVNSDWKVSENYTFLNYSQIPLGPLS